TTFTPAEHIQNTFQYMDNLIWNRGAHSLKMGVSWTHWQYNIALASRLNGTFTFGDGIKALIENKPSAATLFFSEPFRAGLRANLIGIYLQDDINVSPNLTVNLGVRYEFITVPTEVNGKLGNIQDPFQVVPSCPVESVATAPRPCTGTDEYFENPSLKNFSPRVGFSWDPTGSGKSSIRAGFGLFHHQITPAMYSTAPHRMSPFAIVASLSDRDPRQPEIVLPTSLRELSGDSPGVQTPDVQVLTDPGATAYLMQWNLSLQREILPQTAVTATYTGSRGVHLPRGAQVNAPIGEQQADGRWFFPEGIQRHNPGYAGILSYLWDGQSWYNGLRLGLQRRFSEGFHYQLSYQFQKFMDDGSSVSVRRKDFVNSSTSSQYWLDKTLDRALSSYDTTHIFSSNFSVDLPGSGLGGAAGLVLGGWRFNGIISLSTGPPLEIGGDGNATCGFCASRPNLRPGAPNNPNTGDPNAWFGPIAEVLSDDPTDCLTEGSSSFILCTQEQGFFGNLGRNTASMPGLANLDVSIQKNFSIGETADVQFRAEFFNVLNRVNFGVPSRGTFSRGRPNAAFGRITSTTTTSRQIQFALKIIF
ncbi:MAG: TonB-dependent receptor domain-containing protein, partial [Acidobacteriota bacterium]